MKQQIENAIRQHLVITNEPGVKYAVDAIFRLVEDDLSCWGVLTGEDAERFIERAENPVKADPQVVARMKQNYELIKSKAKL